MDLLQVAESVLLLYLSLKYMHPEGRRKPRFSLVPRARDRLFCWSSERGVGGTELRMI